ncbi:MAG: CRTAC1 family protein [Acidobacteriota bacterium]|nr:CRTAC1 family protein [Acidobacteriota bacterium]
MGADNGRSAAVVLLVAAAAACVDDAGPGTSGRGDRAAGSVGELASRVSWVEISAESGLEFRHYAGAGLETPMPAIMGSGAAVFDAEGDGDLDVFLINGGERFPADRGPAGAANALFLQQTDGSFVDATTDSGLGDDRYGMGAAAGDIDNDGDTDLFVSNWGRDSLYLNDGSGHFRDITDRARVGDEGWSTSAVFCDVDGDGLLDLFVARYVDYDPGTECRVEGGRVDYCGPVRFEGLSDRLYRNRGDGRFEDRSRSSGIATLADAGLGVLCHDFDADGQLDLYVANDADPNHLWTNQGDGRFVEDALLVGLAFNRYGVAEGGMGVVIGDLDGDADADVFVSHLIEETNTFYENRNDAGFEDATGTSGLGVASIPYTGFGDALADLDNDGDLDLVVVNGAVKQRPTTLAHPATSLHLYAEPNSLLENVGGGRFLDVTGETGAWGESVEVSRGLVAADLDRDGDLDLLTTQIEGRARLWRNDGGNSSGWIEVVLDDLEHGGSPGAQVVAHVGELRLLRLVQASGGYLTSSPLSVWFGLAAAEKVDRFEVRWPDGTRESFPGAAARQTVTLARGTGTSDLP